MMLCAARPIAADWLRNKNVSNVMVTKANATLAAVCAAWNPESLKRAAARASLPSFDFT